MRFSQRIGKTPIKNILQIESIDKSLMNRIWNTFVDGFFNKISDYSSYNDSDLAIVCKHIWREFFGNRIDEIPEYSNGGVYPPGVLNYIESWYFKEAKWHDVYDFIEFIAGIGYGLAPTAFVKEINDDLTREVAGYRIVDGVIVQLTSNEEIETIEQALSDSSPLRSVNEHLKTSLELLADKQSPNYRNSIKESISAVEAFCKVVTNDDKATLGKALAILEKQHNLHASLKEAYSKLYGFTSDAGGIRHAMLEDGIEIDFADAKYMLVLCSSFINYIKGKLRL